MPFKKYVVERKSNKKLFGGEGVSSLIEDEKGS